MNDEINIPWGSLCTFAATGSRPSFQPVFICRTCSQIAPPSRSSSITEGEDSRVDDGEENEFDENRNDDDDDCSDNERKQDEALDCKDAADTNCDNAGMTPPETMPLCICENCAVTCHEAFGHDVEYVGVGPSYCDCSSIARTPSKESKERVTKKSQLDDGKKLECEMEGCGTCQLQEISRIAAEKLGIDHAGGGGGGGINISLSLKDKKQDDMDNNQQGYFPYEYGVFHISPLCRGREPLSSSSLNTELLLRQAMELVKHTSDTHWIPATPKFIGDNRIENDDDKEDDSTIEEGKEELSELEQLALSIFNHHVKAYNLDELMKDNGGSAAGAEWWVQVKNQTDSNVGTNVTKNDGINGNGEDGIKNSSINDSIKENEAIDLHYDKDEELASAFGLGSFPTLSTVTYLTDDQDNHDDSNCMISTAPTVVFAHTYDMLDEGVMCGDHGSGDDSRPQVLISHPRVGKHLVFDGRLLHGAPAHHGLRQVFKGCDGTAEDVQKNQPRGRKRLRVTFLVNIWLSGRPSRVITLPSSIRSKIQKASLAQSLGGGGENDYDDNCERFVPRWNPPVVADFQKQNVEILVVNEPKYTLKGTESANNDGLEEENVDHKSHIQNRMQLPFVSKGATWINNDEDGSEEPEGLIVSMLPPPPYDEMDTVLVHYGSGLEPLMKYVASAEEEGIEEEDCLDENEYLEEECYI